MKKITLLFSLIGTAFVVPAISAGVVYELESTAADQDQPQTVKVQAQDGLVKMTYEGSQADSEFVIFDSERKTLTVASPEERSYYVIDEKQLSKISESLNAMKQQMEQALAQVPEAQRESMRQMMGGMSGMMDSADREAPEVKVERQGETKTIEGYETTKYVVNVGNRPSIELWVTPWDQIEGADEIRESFESMSNFFEMMMNAMPQVAGGGDDARSSWMRAMRELDGFPVQSTNTRPSTDFTSSSKVKETTTLKSVREVELSRADFRPPEGFERRTLDMPEMPSF